VNHARINCLRAALAVLVALPTLASARPAAPEPFERYTCLIRLAETRPLAAGMEVAARARGGDARATLIQRQGVPLSLALIAGGTDCRLKFGAAIDSAEAGRGPVRVRISTRAGGRSSRVAFEETLHWQGGPEAVWIDREVPLQSGAAPLTLTFEALPSEGGIETAVGWGSPHVVCQDSRPPAGMPPRPHVILISIDTLRADHLGAYGYARATSPNLDVLAAEGFVFENAFAPSPWTLPSHASMLTGLYPEEHRAGHAQLYAELAPGVATLPEMLAAAGYRTIGNTAAGYVSSSYGLDRGFHDWTERKGTSLRSALPGVLDALSQEPSKPTFLFLHTYDVHGPYINPAEYDRFGAACGAEPCAPASGGSVERASWQALGALKLHAHLVLDRFQGIDGVIAAYDSSVAFVDNQLGLLFDHLRRAGMYDQALIIVTSDHGESFLERGSYIGHGYTFFEEEIRVPLIVRRPGAGAGGRSGELVDLTDVASLILDTAKVEPEAPVSGASPFARITGRAPRRALVRGGSAFTGGLYLRTLGWKVVGPVAPVGALGLEHPSALIADFESAEQIFELSNDRGELVNRAGDHTALPEEVWVLRQKLGQIEPPGSEIATSKGLSFEHLEQLRALGYIAE
jgi:arylsulfatase A-like enzyme